MKTAEATGDLIGIKLLIKLQKSQQIHHSIDQRQSQMRQKILDLIEKYEKKDISPEKRQQIVHDLRLI